MSLDPAAIFAFHATQVPPFYNLPVSALNQAGAAIHAWAAARPSTPREALDLVPDPLSILMTFAVGPLVLDVTVTLTFDTVEGVPWTESQHRLSCVFSSTFPPLGHCDPADVATMGTLQTKGAHAATLLLDALRRGARPAGLKLKPSC
jgi:hypothetical protein